MGHRETPQKRGGANQVNGRQRDPGVGPLAQLGPRAGPGMLVAGDNPFGRQDRRGERGPQ
eukprot:6290333-Lingulodinium_polyedra.AAC.1